MRVAITTTTQSLLVSLLTWVSAVVSVVALLSCGCCGHFAKASNNYGSRRPNIVAILVDDLGYNGLGVSGNNQEIKTPVADELARTGVRLTRHYTYKFCSPTRASFLTGRLPGHGIQEINLGMTSPVGLNLNMTSIARKLKSGGYTTFQIGKWHEGFYSSAYTPHGRGFDNSFGFLGGGEDHLSQCHGCENSIPNGTAVTPFSCPAHYSPCGIVCPDQGGVDLYCTDAPCLGRNTTANPFLYAAAITRFIRGHANSSTSAVTTTTTTKATNTTTPTATAATQSEEEEEVGARQQQQLLPNPIFLYLALHNVHQPVESPPEFVNLYPATDYNTTTHARRIYNGMHSGVDFVLGNLTGELRRAGLWNNTILVLTSDNGGTYEHGMPVPGSSNYPLRGHKYSWFEGGVRTVTVVNSPLLPASVQGTTNNALMHISDWWPTFAALAGLSTQDDTCKGSCVPIDGTNVWSVIMGEAVSVRSELLLGVGGPQGKGGAYINGTYKFISQGGNSVAADGWSAQYPGSTPTIPAPHDGSCVNRPCLFDTSVDTLEHHDLATTRPDLVRIFAARYAQLAREKYAPWHDAQQQQWLTADAEEEIRTTCDRDDCWARRLDSLHAAWMEDEEEATAAAEKQASRSVMMSTTIAPCTTLSGLYHDANGAGDVFNFSTNAATGRVDMTVSEGCKGCVFDRASGFLRGVSVSLVAYGRGSYVQHNGTLDTSSCRVHWTAQNRTNRGNWPDFCCGASGPCQTPPSPPRPKSPSCAKMMKTGFWAPWE